MCPDSGSESDDAKYLRIAIIVLSCLVAAVIIISGVNQKLQKEAKKKAVAKLSAVQSAVAEKFAVVKLTPAADEKGVAEERLSFKR